MAEVERTWFRRVINAGDITLVWSNVGDYQVAYDASTATRLNTARHNGHADR